MYTYIAMDRTQIYLDAAQTRELDRRAKAQGTTRSHLIREAVEAYLAPSWDAKAFNAALDNVFGMWADRTDIDEIYADLDQAGRDRLRRLWGDRLDEPPDTEPAGR
jgi:metal-responsive CopG/Arc/MetJ family transcriptional regulator